MPHLKLENLPVSHEFPFVSYGPTGEVSLQCTNTMQDMDQLNQELNQSVTDSWAGHKNLL